MTPPATHVVTLAFILTVIFAQAVESVDHTHFDNHSRKWTILATTSYPGSKFNKRSIPPGGSGVDAYAPVNHLDVTVQVAGAKYSNSFKLDTDQSVIAKDTPGNQYGVSFWLNDGHGNVDAGGSDNKPLVVIYGPG